MKKNEENDAKQGLLLTHLQENGDNTDVHYAFMIDLGKFNYFSSASHNVGNFCAFYTARRCVRPTALDWKVQRP